MLGRKGCERIADCRGEHERPDEMPSAALMLLRGALAMLVGADRDVLGAVVGGELAGAQREHRRRDGHDRREELPHEWAQLRLAQPANEQGRAEHRHDGARILHRQLGRG